MLTDISRSEEISLLLSNTILLLSENIINTLHILGFLSIWPTIYNDCTNHSYAKHL